MPIGKGEANRERDMAGEAYIRKLRKTFEEMPHDIPLLLFADRGADNMFAQAARQVIRAFRELSPRITLKEYDLNHELARKHQVTSSPTLIIAPDRYSIRWLGAPMGEEARTFLEIMLLVGTGKSSLSEQSAKVIRRIDSPRRVKVFVSPTCPYCPQQAVNGVKAAVELPEHVSLEIVDIQAEPEIANQYGAQSVPMAFANDVLIGHGAQAEEVFASSLQKMEPQTIFIPDSDAEQVETDLLIVGGGPAGLTAGIYAVRSGLKAAIVERLALGGQVALTPIVENYPGFTSVGGKTLVDIMVSHALQYTQIFLGEEWSTSNTAIRCRADQPAAPSAPRPSCWRPAPATACWACPGNRGCPAGSYCSTCDGPLFKGKRVIMVGGGNSAVTEALHSSTLACTVTLVHAAARSARRTSFQSNSRTVRRPIVRDTEVEEIRARTGCEVLCGTPERETSTLNVLRGFRGHRRRAWGRIAQQMGLELNEEGVSAGDGRHLRTCPGSTRRGRTGGYKQIVTVRPGRGSRHDHFRGPDQSLLDGGPPDGSRCSSRAVEAIGRRRSRRR